MARFDGPRILAVLVKHEVSFIAIGGFAAAAYGSPLVTNDVDIVPDPDSQNMARLSKALKAAGAKVRAAGVEPLPFDHSGASLLDAQIWNLTTKYGDLDITLQPSGTQGYADLRRDAVEVTIRGSRVLLASLADIVRSKEAAGRDKDRRALPVLRELLARQLRERAGRRPPG
jgi:hypothetical protein